MHDWQSLTPSERPDWIPEKSCVDVKNEVSRRKAILSREPSAGGKLGTGALNGKDS